MMMVRDSKDWVTETVVILITLKTYITCETLENLKLLTITQSVQYHFLQALSKKGEKHNGIIFLRNWLGNEYECSFFKGTI